MLEVRIAVAVDEGRASHERDLKLLSLFVHPQRIVPIVPAKGMHKHSETLQVALSCSIAHNCAIQADDGVTRGSWTYDRCLSLNTGTERPLDAKTPRICSMKYLRGNRC